MRLPRPDDSIQSQLNEFDVWITPSLGEVADTDRFSEELALLSMAFDIIGKATSEFESVHNCRPEAIADVLAGLLEGKSVLEKKNVLEAVASTLFTVAGKSDNNFKCQFPIFLRDTANWSEIPVRNTRNQTMATMALPRVLKSKRFVSLVTDMGDSHIEARLLRQFFSFLLNDDRAINQFWALGHSYFAMKQFGRELDLLAPIVIFRVRGSVMASSGHEPERVLRKLLEEWGLRSDIDFNSKDVIVAGPEQDSETKTRAYDFVLPYRTPGWYEGWNHRLFVQCQFYAGDSGSVSHKNVDQTRSSRESINSIIEDAKFIEYVDGAGYFSSLNSDLRKLLAYEDTYGVFQIRTAPIRLRAYFDQLGFLTPLRIEQTIAQGAKSQEEIKQRLLVDGFRANEIERAMADCVERSLLSASGRGFGLLPERREIVRGYFLLDRAVEQSEPLGYKWLPGKVLVPGYGPFHGVDVDHLARVLTQSSSVFSEEFSDSTTLLSDIKRLAEQGYIMAR